MFKKKKILITAGPTWVSIDRVRVISNIASGETGITLAGKFSRLGAKVTLLLGPVEACCPDSRINLKRFKFFDELKNIIVSEIRDKKYDIVIHSAAVSDYMPVKKYSNKVSSNIKKWSLDLIQTQKIIDLIKKINNKVFLVGFKFEPGKNKKRLINCARRIMKRSRFDLAVANSIEGSQYRAYIVNLDRIYGPFRNRELLTDNLIRVIGENLWSN